MQLIYRFNLQIIQIPSQWKKKKGCLSGLTAMWQGRITEKALEKQTKPNTNLKTLCLTLNTKLKHISVRAKYCDLVKTLCSLWNDAILKWHSFQ